MPLTLTFRDFQLRVCLTDSYGGMAHVTLDPGRVERQLHDIDMLFTAASCRVPYALHKHLENHFTRDARSDATCHFCKLQGKILAAQGRHRPPDPGDSRRPTHIGGTTQVRPLRASTPQALAKRYRDAGLRLPSDLDASRRPLRTLSVAFPDDE